MTLQSTVRPSLSIRAGLALLLAAVTTITYAGAFSQDSLPSSIKVPGGNVVAWESVGSGEITYECRAKDKAADQTEWVFAGPKAMLKDRAGKHVGNYYGPPATWEAMDGSKVTATQMAVAPAGDDNLPYQLVKANPAMGDGRW